VRFTQLGDLPDLSSLDSAVDFSWQRLLANQGEMELPDVIGFSDIQFQWLDYRKTFVDSITISGYSPGYVEVVDLPKDELMVRPLARLSLEDRLFYEATVFSLAPRIDAEIHRAVYSYRWSAFKGDLKRPIGSWVRMQKHGRFFHKNHPDLSMARTDVSSFYENIDIDILIQELRQLKLGGEALTRLHEFLRAFQEMNHVWGLPQGSDASGVLSNFYLLPIDRIIARTALHHLRYSDDIFVFGPDQGTLRKCLLDINRAFRGRHLSMSGQKTDILTPGEVSDAFEDMEKDAIRYNVDIASGMAPDLVREFFDRATCGAKVNSRDVRFSLNQLRRLKDDYAIAWMTRNFGKVPHMAQDLIAYLESFPVQPFGRVYRFCEEVISKRSLRNYAYVELHILGFMMRQQINSPFAYEAAWQIIKDRNEETFLREYAVRYVGLNAHPGDGALLRQEFRRDPSQTLRRALLVAIYESGQDDTYWFDLAAETVPYLRWVCRYLKTEPSIPMPPSRR
jgi:hypothetical protein